MKITNKKGLPLSYVKTAEKSVENPHNDKNSFSATTLLKGDKEILLELRHYNEIVMDVSDMVWTIFGTAVHKVLEDNNDTQDGDAETSITYDCPFDPTYKITGRTDLYNEEKSLLTDHKTGSVWKYIKEDYKDWTEQGYEYAWLYRQKGKMVIRARFICLCKDWSSSEYRIAKLKGDRYPDSPIFVYEFDIDETRLQATGGNMITKARRLYGLIKANVSDDAIVPCSDEERWYTGDTYAIMKKDAVRSLKNCSSKKEAEDYIADKNLKNVEIVFRLGQNRKCMDYCICKEFCNFYKDNCQKKEEGENEKV